MRGGEWLLLCRLNVIVFTSHARGQNSGLFFLLWLVCVHYYIKEQCGRYRMLLKLSIENFAFPNNMIFTNHILISYY